MQSASGAIVIGTTILNILWQAKNKGILNLSLLSGLNLQY